MKIVENENEPALNLDNHCMYSNKEVDNVDWKCNTKLVMRDEFAFMYNINSSEAVGKLKEVLDHKFIKVCKKVTVFVSFISATAINFKFILM